MEVPVGGPEFFDAVEFAKSRDAGVVDLSAGNVSGGDEASENWPITGAFGEKLDRWAGEPEFELTEGDGEWCRVFALNSLVGGYREELMNTGRGNRPRDPTLG